MILFDLRVDIFQLQEPQMETIQYVLQNLCNCYDVDAKLIAYKSKHAGWKMPGK